MTEFIHYRPDSDELDGLLRGRVRAERINDIVAQPTSQRHIDYLQHLRDQYAGAPAIDDKEQYRERAKELLGRAVDAYEKRTGHFIEVCRLYYFQDREMPFVATPDGIDEEENLGLTFHIRTRLDTYERSEEIGVDNPMERHAQAMMLVTGLPRWGHLNYFENPDAQVRKLGRVHISEYDSQKARHLEEEMLAFLLKARQRAIA